MGGVFYISRNDQDREYVLRTFVPRSRHPASSIQHFHVPDSLACLLTKLTYTFICILYKLLIVVKRRKPKAASYGIFGSRSEPVKVVHFKGCVNKVTYIYLSTYFPHSTTTSECTAMLGILKTCIKGGAVVPKFITITRTLPRALLLLFFAKKKSR